MQKNSTIFMLSLTILAVLFASGIFVFMFKVIQNKNEHTSKVLMTLEDKMAEKENMSVVNQRLTEVETTSKTVNSYFVDSKQIDLFVAYLEKIGADTSTDLAVKDVSVSTTEKGSLSLKLSVKGTFSNIMQVVSLLENSPYQINITQTYLNKELVDNAPAVTPNKNPKLPVAPPPILWRADISFSVLSL